MQDIVEDVLAPYGFGIINKLVGGDYCVQYGETDFNFISQQKIGPKRARDRLSPM